MATSGQRLAPILKTTSIRKHASVCILRQQQSRSAANSANAAKYKRSDTSTQSKKKKGSTSFKTPDLKLAEQFSLCDAMRYIRAFEVGQPPTASKYEIAVRLRTLKNGPVIRNRFRLPHPVQTDVRICVIAPEDSPAAKQAKQAGAVLVGEDHVFDLIRDGNVDFDRCICHQDSLQKLNRAGVARILGPRGLMPSNKTGTVVKDVTKAVQDMVGGSEYRERSGVIRMAVGQLGFTPDEMQKNIKTVMDMLKKDCVAMSDRISKEIHEVVLSSTNAPGFSLSGAFKTDESPPVASLSTM